MTEDIRREQLRGVICDLSDCLYYVKLPSQPTRVYCKHPEVHTNPPGTSCPFYRMDWERKREALKKRFQKR